MTDAEWRRFAEVGGLEQFTRPPFASRPPREPYDRDGVTVIEDPHVAHFGTTKPAGYNTVTLTVYGHPAPQGSKRAFALRKNGVLTGKAAVIESSHDRVKSWRLAVIDAIPPESNSFAEPVTVRMVFSLRRPLSHYQTGANSHLLRASAPARPGKAPDLSKLCRATEDALEEVGLLANDSLIVDYGRLAKVWCGEDPDALDVPGAVITIWPAT
jgi:Holliday junction resolvase RusA-like endonuclease